jgi:uncharacterized protein
MRTETIGNFGRFALCIALAGLGGAIATSAHLPLGWLIGALTATAVLSLVDLPKIPVRVMPYGREVSQGIVGMAAGERLSPEVAQTLLALVPVMLAAALATILAACFLSRLLAFLTGANRRTAFFASLPGGVAEMTILAERYGGDPGLVSVAQFLRILLVTLAIPQLVALIATADTDAVLASSWIPDSGTGASLAILCTALVPLGLLLMRVRIPNGWLLAGVLLGGLAGLLELKGAAIPSVVLIAAQILIGASLGARCRPSLLTAGRVFLPTGLAGTAILIFAAATIAFFINKWLGLGLGSLVLALAPGGIAEMSLVATAGHFDPIIVVAFHLVRVLLIIFLSVPLMMIFAK